MRKVFGSTPVPIIMCTAMTAGASALDDCMRAGATDILLKPYERTKMLEKIEQYCGAKVCASCCCNSACPVTGLPGVDLLPKKGRPIGLDDQGPLHSQATLMSMPIRTWLGHHTDSSLAHA